MKKKYDLVAWMKVFGLSRNVEYTEEGNAVYSPESVGGHDQDQDNLLTSVIHHFRRDPLSQDHISLFFPDLVGRVKQGLSYPLNVIHEVQLYPSTVKYEKLENLLQEAEKKEDKVVNKIWNHLRFNN